MTFHPLHPDELDAVTGGVNLWGPISKQIAVFNYGAFERNMGSASGRLQGLRESGGLLSKEAKDLHEQMMSAAHKAGEWGQYLERSWLGRWTNPVPKL